ncbi:hypothetical protein HDV04_003417 [Boothiomyces sp. JEL0838]|nr:hypothetical protein HDV04_003417 [Boothiomyces sp. JEL0838]
MTVKDECASDVVINIPKDNIITQSIIQKYWYSYYMLMILVLIVTSSFTLGSRLIYQASSFHPIEFNGATFEYYFGLFSFSYVMTDNGGDPVNNVYPTEWQTVNYKDACSKIWFSTDTDNGQIIDLSFFCSNTSPWRIVSPFMVVALVLGCAALGLLITNALTVTTFHQWSKAYPIADLFCLKRFFKYSILCCVLLHFTFQSSAMALTAAFVFLNLVAVPSHLSFGFGTLISAGALLNDVFFMVMFLFMYDNMFSWKS